MWPRQTAVLVALCLLGVVTSGAEDKKIPLTEQHRMQLVRTFSSDLVYIRTQFPMGKTGLTLKDGKLSPSGDTLKRQLALWGPSVKPGDRAIITQMEMRGDHIRFEINGGPVKKQKWYQHLQVGVGGGAVSPGGGQDPINNPRGSYVDLVFDHHIPDVTVEQVKQLLWPVFDFDAKTALEAYLESVPPKAKEAIQNHHVLVGMNREMVIASKGRPPKKIREKDGETEFEEWIYGEPPQDVDFVRLVGDEVVRLESMKVDGEKIIHTEREVDLPPTVAKSSSEPEVRPPNAPSLRRPGEEIDTASPAGGRSPTPRPPPDPLGQDGPPQPK